MKLKEFRKFLKQKRIDVALLLTLGDTPNENVLYFTDYGGVGALVIPKDKKPFLVVPEMEAERARKSGLSIKIWKSTSLFSTVKEKLKENGVKHKKVGVDLSSFSVNAFNSLKKKDKIKFCGYE